MSARNAVRSVLAGIVALAVLAPAAGAQRVPARATSANGASVAADPGGAAAIGEQHAEAHAMAGTRQRSFARLTPSRRAQRLARVRRATTAVNARLAGQRDDVGYWSQKLHPLPEYAINAIVLPTGKVLIFGREPLRPSGTRSNLGSAQLFDPLTGATIHKPPPAVPENPDANGNPMPASLFCVGQTLLSDGRVLLVGGNLSDPVAGKPAFSGLNYTFIFDPWTETWETGPKMQHGRWYPTLVKLPSGDVLIAGGLDENGQGLRNGQLDIWRRGETAATALEPLPAGERSDPNETTTPNLPPDARIGLSLYPFMFLVPDGNVALAGPGQYDSAILDTDKALNDTSPGSAWKEIAKPGPTPPQIVEGTYPSAVHQGGTTAIEPDMRAFSGSWNILAIAGAVDPEATPTLRLANPVVDTFDAHPGQEGWKHDPTQDLNQSRFYPNTVLLPDGGIVVVGGGVGASPAEGNYYIGNAPPALRQVELRRPGERTWRLGAMQQEFRTYHSTAWLLPDGRIVSAGDDGREKLVAGRDDAEIYWPPYLFDGDSCALRPAIRGIGTAGGPPAGARRWATLTYGESVGIFSEHAQPGMRATLLAPAATTHGVDMHQRLVPLRVDATVAGGGMNVTMPATAAIAPPGYYLLFVVDADGTPSEARWVQVLPPAEAGAQRGGGTPATVAGPWASPDPRGRSCSNPDGTTRHEFELPATTPTTPTDPPKPTPKPKPVKLTAKLGLDRATIDRTKRRLDLLAPITGLASGKVRVELLAAGRRTRLSAPVDAARRRIRLLRAIPAAQARLGTGILTLTYPGNDATLPQTVRLRAAARPANLSVKRPTLGADGRLRASGTISRLARGVVRVELQFVSGDTALTFAFRAPVRNGRWSLDTRLARDRRDAIAARAGAVQSYALFTGYAPAAMRGEMRTYQVLGAR